jgi:tetratricopeptide (TPR) repeat protein
MHQRYTRLPKSQQLLVSVLLGSFIILLINSVLLLLFDRSTAATYMIMLLSHVILGTLLTAPIIVFITLHIFKMPLSHNRGATAAGLFTALSLGILLATGFVLVIKGASVKWNLWLHIAATVTTILGFITHVSLKRGVRYHFLEWAGLWRGGWQKALRHPLNITIIAGVAISIIFIASLWLDQRQPAFVEDKARKNFAPGQASLAHENFLKDDDLARSESCGQAGCHPDIYKQWNESVHHFSSFNNPYYRKTVELMVSEKGVAPARWCASCHDPLVLFPGRMQDGQEIDMDHWTGQAGITCLSCHAVAGLRDVKGNGRLVMATPDEYPFARSESKIGQWIHNKMVKSKPEPHRRAMLKPAMHRTGEFCGACHKVGIPPEVNDYRWKRGQNQYDNWHNSGASGNIVRSFYLPAQAKNCIDCHMPLVPSNDEGNDNGLVRSHRFATANSTLPMLNQFKDQQLAVQKVLQDSIVTLDLFTLQVNGKTYGPDEAMPVLRPNDVVKLTVVARNRKVGHIFPEGTNDSNEPWIEVRAKDKNGKTVLASGLLDAGGHVDSTAHFFRAKLVSRESQLIGRRDVQNWVATIYANVIGPGAARTAHYRFKVPAGVSITELEATLNYRKFMQEYNKWVFRDKPQDLPNQPIIAMATASRRAGSAPAANRPLWERWNDYGIGLFLEGDTRVALEAFKKVTTLAPKNPEGPINQGRVLIAEGQVDRAIAILQEAENRKPGYLKTAYFRGAVYKKLGEYDQALAEWKKVAEAYPKDRVLLLDMGRLEYLSGRYDAALQWIDRVLAIDPEDLGGLYNRMLTLGALGRDKELAEARKLYEYHKDDEDAMAVTALYKQRHPAANNEAQAIHVHRLWPADPKANSSQPKTSFYDRLSVETKPLPKAAGSLR